MFMELQVCWLGSKLSDAGQQTGPRLSLRENLLLYKKISDFIVWKGSAK